MLTLYSGPLSMFGAKVQIALLEKGLPFDLRMVPFDASDGYRPKHLEVVRVNPVRQQVPVLIDGELEIFDSTQIFEYLEDLRPVPPLWPGDAADRARARQLEHRSDEIFFPNVIRLFGLQDDMASEAAISACAACARHYVEMDTLLARGDWLAGAYSFADIAFYLAQIYAERKGAPLTEAAPRLIAWRQRVGARPAVREVVGPMMRWLQSQGRPVPPYLQSHLQPSAG